MMQIILEKISKKYNYEWIFKNIQYRFEHGKRYAIIGNNGSGKSTLLKAIAGLQPISSGKIIYQYQHKNISAEYIYQYLSLATPYLELIEELTLEEAIHFHQQFKKLTLSTQDLIKQLTFEKARQKPIRFFSSGMKQKLKLALAFYSQCPICLLDEPTSNLDATNIEWYQEEINKYSRNHLLIICSNQPEEYKFFDEIIDINTFKK